MTTTEYGIFSDEGCLECGFYSESKARIAARGSEYADEPDVYVAEMCPDHEEQPRDTCEECFTDDDETE
jgi:hypothetical protein